jgi:hypothetical protein
VNRADLGFVAVHAVLVVPGMALLYGTGLVNRIRDLPAAIGPAYLFGVAAVMVAMIALLVIGLNGRLPMFGAVVAAMTVVLAAPRALAAFRGRRIGSAVEESPERGEPPGRGETWGWWIAVLALVLFFGIGASAYDRLPIGGDAATIWTFKSIAFFHLGGELNGVFTGANPGPARLDYPILQPLLESIFYRTMGGEHLQRFHTALWLLYAAFVWTAGWLLRRRGLPRLAVIGPLFAIAVAPAAAKFLASGYADMTVALFAGAGALCIGIWLDGGPGRFGLLGGLMLAAAANSKNEGQLAAVAVVLAAASVVAFSREHRWRDWLGMAGVTAAGSLPWVLWRSSHDLENVDARGLFESLDWNLLTDRIDRLGTTLGDLLLRLATQGNWTWLVPTFLALAGICLVKRTARPVAAFYLSAGVLMFLGLTWVYWTGHPEIAYWLFSSAERTVAGVVAIAAVGVTHLTSRVLGTPDEPDGRQARAAPSAD